MRRYILLFIITILLLSIGAGSIHHLLDFSSETISCSNYEKNARKYLLEGENIANIYQVTTSTEKYCLFKVENPKVKNTLIPINPNSASIVADSKEAKTVISYYHTEKFLIGSSLNKSIEKAYDDYIAVKSGNPHFGKTIRSVLMKDYVKACYSIAGPLPVSVLKICSGEDLKKDLLEMCEMLSFQLCADWEETIENFFNIIGRLNQINDSDHKIYHEEVDDFLEKTAMIKDFLHGVNNETNYTVNHTLDDFNLQEKKIHIANKSQEEAESIDERVTQRRENLKRRKDDLKVKLDKTESWLINQSRKGNTVDSLYASYCRVTNDLPPNNLLYQAKFLQYEERLENISDEEVLSETSREARNATWVRSKWNQVESHLGCFLVEH